MSRPARKSLSGVLDVEALGGPHDECLEEIRQVLSRRGFGRLGVALLDSRTFELAADEVLLATSDAVRRQRVIRVVKKSHLDENGVDMQTAAVGFETRFSAAMEGGSEQAFEKAKVEIGEIKIGECKKADPGYRCSWADAKGRNGGRARFVKDGDEWRLADVGG